MRLDRFTRHALAAVALAALAAGNASAAVDMFLKLKDAHGKTSTAGVQSFSWGASQTSHGTGGGMAAGSPPAQLSEISGLKFEVDVIESAASAGAGSAGSARVAKVDAFTIKQSVRTEDVGEARVAAAGAAASAEKFGAVGGMHRDAGVNAPRDAASGLATGKRQHKPIRITNPLDRGSLTVAGSLPGCAVGATYPEATLEGAGMRYELKDIQITSCATGQLSLDYARVQVRGWDPAKKQE